MKSLALAAALLAGSALAQTERVVREPDRTVVRKKQHVDFSGAVIDDGAALRPAVNLVLVPNKPAFQNLIRIRADFVPELVASPDQL